MNPNNFYRNNEVIAKNERLDDCRFDYDDGDYLEDERFDR